MDVGAALLVAVGVVVVAVHAEEEGVEEVVEEEGVEEVVEEEVVEDKVEVVQVAH